MLKILQARLQQYVNQEVPDIQAGFWRGRRIRDQIANIRWIMEKARVPENIHFSFMLGSTWFYKGYTLEPLTVDHRKLENS